MRNSFNNSAKIISILAVFSLLIVTSAAVMAQDQSAPLPTWTKGQTWAISGERNLSSLAKDNLDTLQNELAELGHNISIEDLNVNGKACSYIVFKVTDVTEENYTLGYCAAIHVRACVNAKINGDFPVTGINGLNDEGYVSASAFVTASLCLAVTSSGTVTIDRSTMAIERIVSNTSVDQVLKLKVDCTPSTNSILNALNVKMTYNALNVDESLHLKLNDTIEFSPALQLLEFPMSVGSKWTVDSTMTVTGKVTGIFKETGLPNSILTKIDENAAAFNGTLYLQDLPSLGGIPLDNGAFGPIPIELKTNMTCVGVSLADQGCNKGDTVFDVVESQTGTHIYYSPDTEFITGIMLNPQFDLEGLMSLGDAAATSSTSDSSVDQPSSDVLGMAQLDTSITMVPIDPASATQAIENITSGQGMTLETTTTTTANTVTGANLLDSIGLLATIMAIALVGAVIGGFVLLRVKKKNEP